MAGNVWCTWNLSGLATVGCKSREFSGPISGSGTGTPPSMAYARPVALESISDWDCGVEYPFATGGLWGTCV